MSRFADLKKKLPEQLLKFPESNHVAIVDTFCDLLEEGWDDSDINQFLNAGLGISEVADRHIEQCRQWLVMDN